MHRVRCECAPTYEAVSTKKSHIELRMHHILREIYISIFTFQAERYCSIWGQRILHISYIYSVQCSLMQSLSSYVHTHIKYCKLFIFCALLQCSVLLIFLFMDLAKCIKESLYAQVCSFLICELFDRWEIIGQTRQRGRKGNYLGGRECARVSSCAGRKTHAPNIIYKHRETLNFCSLAGDCLRRLPPVARR